ncbi:hypothetical protein L8C07_25720 [Paenibacillus sp. CMAA1739]|uniref:hypothetical protein n=1 Tax=Paenibacillus ottowii TaxID=2315729 RepID=UPI002DBF0E20|nr:hypothetical protein [Paenibacillus sp. CMAA1739]MEC4569349.1 hypothetical protein [Paenibacillus sp. CMAA1739]
MAQWSDSPRLSGPPDSQDLGQLLLYVKDLANTVAKMAKDLEFIINGNLDANNIRANSIQTKNLQAGSVSADKIQAGAITSEKIQANAVTADKIQVRQLSAISADMGKITAGEIYGAYIATSEDRFPMVTLTPDGLTGYNSRGGEALSLGQSNEGGALLFMDDGSPRGSIFGDSEGFHMGNMASVHIKSIDDKTYLDGAVSFENATEVSGLKMGYIEGLRDKISDLENSIGEFRGELVNGLIVNAAFDPASRNLKLFSQTRTVATVNIPAGTSSTT